MLKTFTIDLNAQGMYRGVAKSSDHESVESRRYLGERVLANCLNNLGYDVSHYGHNDVISMESPQVTNAVTNMLLGVPSDSAWEIRHLMCDVYILAFYYK